MEFAHIENQLDVCRGSIEIVCGSMFSGKTEELLRRLRRAKIANQEVRVFKPSIDTRYDEVQVVSHDRKSLEAIPVSNSADIERYVDGVDVVGIDEAQFFDLGLVDALQRLADGGIRVIVAGLDMDFRRAPFGPMPHLMAIADSVDKIHAICVKCGRLASYSHRLITGEEQVILGELKEYSPLCRCCYLRYQKL